MAGLGDELGAGRYTEPDPGDGRAGNGFQVQAPCQCVTHSATGSELIAIRSRTMSTWHQLIGKMQRKIVLNIKIIDIMLLRA